MHRVKVIVNPAAGRGYAAKMMPKVRHYLGALGVDYDLVYTAAAGDAIRLTQEACDDGFDTIVSVGGDGTTHEVVNGLMLKGDGEPVGTLACIPAGSGNDFAIMHGVPEDTEGACRLLAEGATRVVDVGQVTIDGRIKRYFGNVVGIGFDGLAARETRKHRRLRGLALYLPVVLKTIFVTMRPVRAEIIFDGERVHVEPLMVVVCNGQREGGGFFVAPNARSDDGMLDVIIADTMSKLQMLAMVPRFLKGTHLSDRRISAREVKHFVMTSQDPLYAHVDGEILCDEAHHIEIKVIPGCLRVISAPRSA